MSSSSHVRHAVRDARAAAADGSALRWPGASSAFALFAEVLFTGVLITALALPLVTVPLALAVGARHLRRFVLGESSTLREAWEDARAGALRSLPVGLVLVAASGAIALDLVLVSSGALPGGIVVGTVCAAVLASGIVVLLLACAAWTPDSRWLPLLREAATDAARQPRRSGAVLLALLLAAVVTWQLALLAVPAAGCTVFAAVVMRLAGDPRPAEVADPAAGGDRSRPATDRMAE